MENLQSFLAMGGYAAFIWPSYLISVLVLGGVLFQSSRRMRETERELSTLRPNENGETS